MMLPTASSSIANAQTAGSRSTPTPQSGAQSNATAQVDETAEPIVIDGDNFLIKHSAPIKPGVYFVIDEHDDGAIWVRGADIVVDFQGVELVGAKAGAAPDTYDGIGVFVRGRNITIRNLKVRGYRVGIAAYLSWDLTLENCDVSDNFRQRLGSTPQREDASDWLWPHKNDDDEWMNRYGAGILIKRCDRAVIRGTKARNVQNGIILDRVNASQVYDNDCSFLSGWGLAMWRCDSVTVSRNAFDFCIRGYSHGVYNRGQDSAGILMFEQNCNNIIVENSATHGGDGLFAFGGREALGEDWLDAQKQAAEAEGKPTDDIGKEIPERVLGLHKRRGNNDNVIAGNDLSYAAAHGLELTFSFGNRIYDNRMVGNAICGVWGGYSQDTKIVGNTLAENGDAGYGLERGGVNIEHGAGNVIAHNTFKSNACGVHLWSDDDAGIMKTPWAHVNHKGSTGNVITGNTFDGDKLALHLRKTTNTQFVGNTLTSVAKEIETDAPDEIKRDVEPPAVEPSAVAPSTAELPTVERRVEYTAIGETRPVGARKHLAGREHIIMTEWGPYDYESVLAVPATVRGGREATFRVLAPGGQYRVTNVVGDFDVTPMSGSLPAELRVTSGWKGLLPFALTVEAAGRKLEVTGTLLSTTWAVKHYKWDPSLDPRESAENWQKIISAEPIETKEVDQIDFPWRGGAPSAQVPADRFATVAEATVQVHALGERVCTVETVSDDGVRVLIDGKVVLENWTWHGPTVDRAEVRLSAGEHKIRIEHFEIDGWAQLSFTMSTAATYQTQEPAAPAGSP